MPCIECLEDRPILARQLCSRCYRLYWKAGKEFPPVRRILSAALAGELWSACTRNPAFEVSGLGRLRSVKRDLILKPFWGRNGYLTASWRLDCKQRSFEVHKLVLEAFVGPRPEGLVACHYDDDRSNNRLTNLRWDTPAANRVDAVRNGRVPAPGSRTKKEFCKRGHKFTERNSAPQGARVVCRSCRVGMQYLRNHPPVGDYELALQAEADRFYVSMGMAA